MEYPYFVVKLNGSYYGSYQTKRGAKTVYNRLVREQAIMPTKGGSVEWLTVEDKG